MKHYLLSFIFVLTTFISVNVSAATQPKSKISEPKFGEYTIGDDYFLANYTQLIQYWETLEKESDRIKLVDFGTTPEGRTMKLAIITSGENHKNLKRYQDISVRLAKAEGLNDEEAKALAVEGKAVVWIDGGLHATETINSSALFTTAYDLLSRDDTETLRILDNVILLLVPANPDGMDLVSDWYMKESDPKKRNMSIPRLYQKYVGHDNNRDSYIANLAETEAINRQMYIEWIPQIMYNQHQTGPAGTVLFFSPFRDPFNYNQDPLVPIGIDLVSAAVHNRFLAEGKPGAVMRNAANYSTWFNGGDRTTVGFHNQIGLMHEIIGSPTPINIPLIPSTLLPGGNQPFPIGPQQEWHQRQSIDYVISADRAILDIAAKMREDFLYRIYLAGKNSIKRGNQDYWTLTPKHITKLETAYANDRKQQRRDTSEVQSPFGRFGRGAGIPVKFYDDLKTPETRDPRGYILPSDQVDFLTATKFINALQKAGVDVHRATKDFTVAGKTYPAGSYVVKAAQAFRPHLRDMFEPQDHPDDLQYPGGPPRPPYDVAGYTLAFQMGVQFDRILDGFDGPFEKIDGLLTPPAGKIQGSGNSGYLLSHQVNDAFVGTTRLLADGEEIYWLTAPFTANGKTYPEGTIYIPSKSSTRAHLQALADKVGLSFDAISSKPQKDALKIRPVKVALWDRYGGSMDSGWIRWLFEQAFPFPFDVIYPQAIDAGNLKKKYDVIIFPGGAIPAYRPDANFQNFRQPDYSNVPDEYKDRTGNITADKTIPQLKKFVEDGGVLLAIGSSSELGYHLGLPIINALAEIKPDGSTERFPRDKFYLPGSVLRVKVDNTTPVAYGVPEDLDLMYNNNPVFHLLPEANQQGVNSVAWFSNAEPLRSGWAWGQHYLNGGTAIVEATLGKGKVFLFGPEITFRAQPHASFKFLFNGIYYAGAVPVRLQ
ncbi:peptidase [Bacteroidia bacterium]|nr:peptidase [Bacteroidia bacterium]